MDLVINSTSRKYLEDNCEKFITVLKSVKDEYWDKDNFLEELPNKYKLSLHATINEALVGYIIASSKDNRAYIHKFMVDEKYRGKKIGNNLLDEFGEVAGQLNFDKIELTVERDNLPAIKFYRRNGFKISGSRPDSVTGNTLFKMVKQKDNTETIVSIHQPNFLPWLGYFDKIARSDIFIALDDVQLVRGKSYTCRAKILSQGKELWLSVPILDKSEKILIKDSRLDNKQNWKKKHLKTIYLSYKKSLYFEEIYEHIKGIYDINSDFLVDYNIKFINETCSLLGLNTNFIKSSDISSSDLVGLQKIIELIQSVGGTKYISGTGAGSRRYIDGEVFKKEQIELVWQPELKFVYPQYNSEQFVKNLSIIDVLFNAKDKLKDYITNLNAVDK